MSYWETTAERSQGVATPEQLESAAYRLVSEQVLYASDSRSRVAYALIDRFEREFRHALAALGVRVLVNRQLRYACAVPSHAKVTVASVDHTLLALVLRKIYDESAQAGELNDDGEVLCDLVELEEKYRLATSRELPTGGRLEDAMRTMRRWGISKVSEDEPLDDVAHVKQPYIVVIRPGIADVLGELALQRLALFQDSPLLGTSEEPRQDDEGDES